MSACLRILIPDIVPGRFSLPTTSDLSGSPLSVFFHSPLPSIRRFFRTFIRVFTPPVQHLRVLSRSLCKGPLVQSRFFSFSLLAISRCIFLFVFPTFILIFSSVSPLSYLVSFSVSIGLPGLARVSPCFFATTLSRDATPGLTDA